MTRLARLFTLSGRDVARLVEAAAATLAAEIGLRLTAPTTWLAFARRAAPRGRRDPNTDLARLAWLVDLADRYVPGRSSCLRRTLVLAWMLGRRGIQAEVRIGVARAGGALAAHAWLETAGGDVFGLAGETVYASLSPTASAASGSGPGGTLAR